jgi:Type I phosphodiesterase / nucleotide pyrophosphatase
MRSLRLTTIFAALALAIAAAQTPRPAVVLVTLDGARIEEVFGGLDAEIVRSQLRAGERLEDQPIYKRFWAPTPEERRARLMPFFWGTLMREHGSIAGNPARGSRVHLANGHAFSYPGYAEMLLGQAHDDTVKSNAPTRNPYPTVLEFIKRQAGLTKQQVAVFTSWIVSSAIVEHTPDSLTVNSGYTVFESPSEDVRRQSALQFETPTPWNDVRHDVYTFSFAMDHLARHKPHVLYLGLGETDDWAHDGRYDRVLEAFARGDQYLKQLWTWLQSQPEYRGNTHILITTDHGRGHTPKDWKGHGQDVVGASETWMAFVSPSMNRRGEWSGGPPLVTAQVAATLITWMGGDWKAFDPDAAPPVR